MKVIIFGGSGFIGSVLKKEFEHVKMGVRDLSKVKEGTFFLGSHHGRAGSGKS